MRISDWSSDVCSSDLIVPTLDYTDTDIFTLTDPQGWGNNGTQQVVQAGFLNRPSFKDDLKSLRASLNGEFADSVVSGWEVGANFSRRSEEHTSELQSLMRISYAVFCLKKKKDKNTNKNSKKNEA